MMSRAFYSYGKFCSSHTWEVIVAFLTLTICVFSVAPSDSPRHCIPMSTDGSPTVNTRCYNKEVGSGVAVMVTLMRCLAVLYGYNQFRSLKSIGSNYLVGIAGLFTVFSTVIFCTSVINFVHGDFSEVLTALPLFVLLADLPKATLLAQFALVSSNKEEVRENIARGMSILGPSLTLDTMVEMLAIGVGTISGVKRMEELSYVACLSVAVNYVIFMTFFPACLSLALELAHPREGKPVWQFSSLSKVIQLETEQAPNPVIQRVKVIMSAGLTLVHTLSRWQLSEGPYSSDSNSSSHEVKPSVFYSRGDIEQVETTLRNYLNYENLVMFGIIFALAIKYLFFDSRDNENLMAVAQQATSRPNGLRVDVQKSKTKEAGTSATPTILVSQDSDTESVIVEGTARSGSRQHSTQPFFIGDDSNSDCSEDVELVDKEVQTEESTISEVLAAFKPDLSEPRTLELLVSLLNSESGPKELTDDEVLRLVQTKRLQPYRLESALGDPVRGVHVRRLLLEQNDPLGKSLATLPYTRYDYSLVLGACCENVVGYMPIPVGIAGPLLLDGKKYHVPMATTEGCLIASTNRGCRALTLGGGVRSSIVGDGMTRAPVVRFPSATRAAEVLNWMEVPENHLIIKEAFDSTSRFARVTKVQPRIAGRCLFIRIVARTGDAMGMNMLSKGSEVAMSKLKEIFPDMELIGISGNVCTDKKPSAVNWIEGRGKSVVCEAKIPEQLVHEILKTDVPSLVELNISKNLIGSSLAGSIGGFNAHAANIVTAIYIATGQDPAQNVGSSNCITLIEPCGIDNRDLYISCTMPSMELGTIGGGTILPPQAACLDLLGVRGSCIEEPGRNAKQLARIVCGTVLAAELSVLSALAAGHLVKSHLKHNRSAVSVNATPSASPAISQLANASALFATSCTQQM